MNYQKNILLFILVVIATCSSFSQDSGFDKPVTEKNRKEFSVYLDTRLFNKDYNSLLLFNVEMVLIKKKHFVSPAFSAGFGIGFSEYGLGPYAVPIEFKLLFGKSDYKIETGIGIMPVGADVMITGRFGFRTYLFRHLLVRLAYTPYFMVPYGDREYNEPYIDIKSDVSIGVGYRFGK
jgi:hypothetical protein